MKGDSTEFIREIHRKKLRALEEITVNALEVFITDEGSEEEKKAIENMRDTILKRHLALEIEI